MIQNILYKNIRNVLSHWEEKHYENNGVRKTKQNRSIQCLYHFVLSVVRKYQGSLKIMKRVDYWGN